MFEVICIDVPEWKARWRGLTEAYRIADWLESHGLRWHIRAMLND